MNRVFLFIMSMFLYCSITSGNPSKPNFIIFIADDVSWNDIGCYGNKDVKTPTIDKLADRGMKFTNVYLTASSCSPSRNSIFAGRYPHNTGAAELHTQPPGNMISFPAVLKDNGYYCAFSGKFHAHDYITPAFDVISKDYEEIGNSGSDSWVETLKNRPENKPFFMWFASLDAHRGWGKNRFSGTHNPDSLDVPFYLANGPETRKDLAQYYDEVYRFDYRVGEVMKVLAEQNAVDNTFIVIMADNGRPFPHSKTRVNDRGMKTPFIISWPLKINDEGSVCSSLVSAIDIGPTILNLAGAEIPAAMQGKSFQNLIQNPMDKFRNYVFAEHNWHDYEAFERMVRSENFMLIYNANPHLPNMGPADAIGSPSHQELVMLKNKGELSAIQTDVFVTPRPKEELYDYRKDPLQLLNLASVPAYNDTLIAMRNILIQWMTETGDYVPENLTRSWFLREPGYKKTEHHGQRGEMPGSRKKAAEIDNSGPF